MFPFGGSPGRSRSRATDDLLTYLAKCCNPLPGEEIVGYVTRGKGVAVHARHCPNVRNLHVQPRPRDRGRVGGQAKRRSSGSTSRSQIEDRTGDARDRLTRSRTMKTNIRQIEARTPRRAGRDRSDRGDQRPAAPREGSSRSISGDRRSARGGADDTRCGDASADGTTEAARQAAHAGGPSADRSASSATAFWIRSERMQRVQTLHPARRRRRPEPGSAAGSAASAGLGDVVGVADLVSENRWSCRRFRTCFAMVESSFESGAGVLVAGGSGPQASGRPSGKPLRLRDDIFICFPNVCRVDIN